MPNSVICRECFVYYLLIIIFNALPVLILCITAVLYRMVIDADGLWVVQHNFNLIHGYTK